MSTQQTPVVPQQEKEEGKKKRRPRLCSYFVCRETFQEGRRIPDLSLISPKIGTIKEAEVWLQGHMDQNGQDQSSYSIIHVDRASMRQAPPDPWSA